jgi:hypothetical protein
MIKNQRKERLTSSHHDLYELGYTRVTMAFTNRCKNANSRKSL